jgi:hypothetical protein
VPWSVHMGFVVDKVVLGQVSIRIQFLPVSIIHHCSIFSYVSPGDWTVGPLVATVFQSHCLPPS